MLYILSGNLRLVQTVEHADVFKVKENTDETFLMVIKLLDAILFTYLLQLLIKIRLLLIIPILNSMANDFINL